MKLLLTSNGLLNKSIVRAFEELVGKEPKDCRIAFIPTAANPIRENKQWLIDDLYRIKELGYIVDILELTALKQNAIKDALSKADVVFVGGGNTFYLSYWMQKSGLFDLLPEILESKVYAGISAGSMMAGASLALSSQALSNPKAFNDEDYDEIGPAGESSGRTLKLVDIIFRPHLNSRLFSRVNKEHLEEKARGLKYPVYALDDESALKISGSKIEVISEGEWVLVNEK